MILLAAINQLAAVYRGRGRAEAYLELAQEHFLDWLRVEHMFDDDAVVFKGGTAIRKFVLGNAGRFSTDLDFAVVDLTYADHILERLRAGVDHEGVSFVLEQYDPAARKGTWQRRDPGTWAVAAGEPGLLGSADAPASNLPGEGTDPGRRRSMAGFRAPATAGGRHPGNVGGEVVPLSAGHAWS